MSHDAWKRIRKGSQYNVRIKTGNGVFSIDLTGQRGARLVKLSVGGSAIELTLTEAKRVAYLILAEAERHAPNSK